MTPNQLHELKDELRGHIQEVVEKTVNGKVDKLHQEMSAFIHRAEPAIVTFENLTWGKRFLLGAMIFLATLIGLIIAIKQLFE